MKELLKATMFRLAEGLEQKKEGISKLNLNIQDHEFSIAQTEIALNRHIKEEVKTYQSFDFSKIQHNKLKMQAVLKEDKEADEKRSELQARMDALDEMIDKEKKKTFSSFSYIAEPKPLKKIITPVFESKSKAPLEKGKRVFVKKAFEPVSIVEQEVKQPPTVSVNVSMPTLNPK